MSKSEVVNENHGKDVEERPNEDIVEKPENLANDTCNTVYVASESMVDKADSGNISSENKPLPVEISATKDPQGQEAKLGDVRPSEDVLEMEDDVKTEDHNGETAKSVYTLAAQPFIGEDDDGTPEDQAAFMKALEHFHRERAMDFEPPKFEKHQLNCLKLWRIVIRLGGYDRVTGSKLWQQVEESYQLLKTCKTVYWIFRIFYEKYLLEFERHKTHSGELQLPIVVLPEVSGADVEGTMDSLGENRDASEQEKTVVNEETNITMLSEDIEEQILLKLPSNTLLKFQYCKRQWEQLIWDPVFIHKHVENSSSRNEAQLLVINKGAGLKIINVNTNISKTLSVQGDVKSFLGSCDGLVLCKLSNSKIAVVNPSLKQFVLRNRGPVICLCGRVARFVASWFGHHPHTKEYVLVLVDRVQSTVRFRVCTLSRRISNPQISESELTLHGAPFEASGTMGVFLNDKLHFPFRVRDAVFTKMTILVCDFQDEGTIQCQVKSAGILGIVQGCLSTICIGDDGTHEVWIMSVYADESSWRKFVNIAYDLTSDTKLIPLLFCPDGFVILNGDSLPIPKYSFRNNEKTLLTARSRVRDGGILFFDSLVSPHTLALENRKAMKKRRRAAGV